MRPSLRKRLFDLFALLVSVVVCAGFLIAGTVSHDRGAAFIGLLFIAPAYAAGRVMLRDWKLVETA